MLHVDVAGPFNNVFHQCWIDAENVELQNLENHQTYVEVPISEVPKDMEIIPTMEVYSVKNHKDLPTNVVEKYKVRVVVRGDYQVYSVNYVDTYSPVIKMPTLCFSLHFVHGTVVDLRRT
ncbi:hypothetical protein HDU81_004756 [Chytriomyces hyalinus]|nr:hypothetical protein HDU81_004756 [Chytriomyces hyalinus]